MPVPCGVANGTSKVQRCVAGSTALRAGLVGQAMRPAARSCARCAPSVAPSRRSAVSCGGVSGAIGGGGRLLRGERRAAIGRRRSRRLAGGGMLGRRFAAGQRRRDAFGEAGRLLGRQRRRQRQQFGLAGERTGEVPSLPHPQAARRPHGLGVSRCAGGGGDGVGRSRRGFVGPGLQHLAEHDQRRLQVGRGRGVAASADAPGSVRRRARFGRKPRLEQHAGAHERLLHDRRAGRFAASGTRNARTCSAAARTGAGKALGRACTTCSTSASNGARPALPRRGDADRFAERLLRRDVARRSAPASRRMRARAPERSMAHRERTPARRPWFGRRLRRRAGRARRMMIASPIGCLPARLGGARCRDDGGVRGRLSRIVGIEHEPRVRARAFGGDRDGAARAASGTSVRTSTTACGSCRRKTSLSISSRTSACTTWPAGNGVPGAPNAVGSVMALGR